MSVCLVCSQSQLCADGGWSSSHIAPALLLCLPLAERHPFSPSASLHPSLPPMPKLAFTSDGFSTDDYGLETRERKKTCVLLEEGAYARRDIALILFPSGVLVCGIHLHRAKELHVCEFVGPVCVSHPSPPSASLSVSPPSRSSGTQLAGCSSKNLPANRRGEERNGRQRVKKNAGKRRDREERRQRLVSGEKTRGQKD